MKNLITGAAGFIGYNFCHYLLKNKYKNGIDNINNYYSTRIKLDRLKRIKKDLKILVLKN